VYNKLGYGGLAESYYNSAKKIIVKEKLDILPKTIEGKLMNVDWLLVSSIFLYQKGSHFAISSLLIIRGG
jgi:hypothetical protein